MSQQVDARGLSCPQPVILARQAIQAGAFPIVVLVDTATAVENVTRLAQNSGLSVVAEQAGGEYKLTVDRRS